MNNLTLFFHNGQWVVDSRHVAEMVDKPHNDLMKSIRQYCEYLTQGNFSLSEFFIPNKYTDTTGRTLPCYFLTRRGCDMVANKMTGEKGVLFTAAYVTKFEEMERQLKAPAIPTTTIEILQLAVNQMAEQEKRLATIEDKLTVANHRINSLDATNIDGTPRQRLEKMMRKYAFQNGILFAQAWKDFDQAFNMAYRTNITLCRRNHEMRIGQKVSRPEFLEKTGLIEDAIRVADKMLNRLVVAQ